MLCGICQRRLVVAKGGVGIAKAPTRTTLSDAVLQFFRDPQMSDVVLNCFLIVPHQRVCVAKTVTRLCLEGAVPEVLCNL